MERQRAADLLAIQLRTLMRFDERGRILPPAPRVHVSSCPGTRLVCVRADIPDAEARAWLECDDETLRGAVEAHAPVSHEYRGPAFVLPALAPSDDNTVPVDSNVPLHPELVARGWKHDETPPYFGVVRDGFAVSLCYSARSSPEAAEAGAETASDYRGRGLILHAVAAWATAVQRSGRLALYSTEWTNAASRRVAAKLGALEYGENWHLT